MFILTLLIVLVVSKSQVKSKTGFLNPSLAPKSNGNRSSFVMSTPSRRRLKNGGTFPQFLANKIFGRTVAKKRKLSLRISILLNEEDGLKVHT